MRASDNEKEAGKMSKEGLDTLQKNNQDCDTTQNRHCIAICQFQMSHKLNHSFLLLSGKYR